MKPTRIFLDIDDVLNRFTMAALKHVGCDVEVSGYEYDPAWGWDIVKAANALGGHFTRDEFWARIGRDFWATVPVSAECYGLLGVCASLVGAKNVCLLSSPPRHPDCLAGKLEWIHTFLPKRMHRQFLFGPRKHFCARPDALLIDDRDKNVDDFRKHGGMAILVPRPWNSAHSSCRTVEEILEEHKIPVEY